MICSVLTVCDVTPVNQICGPGDQAQRLNHTSKTRAQSGGLPGPKGHSGKALKVGAKPQTPEHVAGI